jgi:ribosomal protein S4E
MEVKRPTYDRPEENLKPTKVEFWTYGCQNGTIQIWFDKGTRYIEIGDKDFECMRSWVDMDKKMKIYEEIQKSKTLQPLETLGS